MTSIKSLGTKMLLNSSSSTQGFVPPETMARNKYDLIRDIDINNEMCMIKVRILRMWSMKSSQNPTEISSLSMVLIDEEGSKIQATIFSNDLIKKFARQLREGECYNMETFRVTENTAQFRATNHPCRLAFNPHTQIQKCMLNIATEAYDFVPIKDISSGKVSTDTLIDVIGFLKSFGALAQFHMNNEAHDKLSFSLADSDDNTVDCILFGDCATNAYYSKEHDLQPPIVVVIQLTRLKLNLSGNLQISNSWSATRILFNPNIPKVCQLLQRLPSSPTSKSPSFTQVIQVQSPYSVTQELLHSNNRINISDISASNEPTQFTVLAKIQKLQTSFGWWYSGCTKCSSKPKQKDGHDYCYGCKTNVQDLAAKFKIHYQISDATGETSIVFFDRVASKLLQTTAEHLLQQLKQENRPYSFPKQLNDIVGQKMILRLSRSRVKIPGPSSSLTVIDYKNDQTSVQQFTLSSSQQLFSDTSDNEGLICTPTSSRSVDINTNESQTDDMDHLTLSQLQSQRTSKSKKNRSSKRGSPEEEDVSLSDFTTPNFSTNKQKKFIKHEKKE